LFHLGLNRILAGLHLPARIVGAVVLELEPNLHGFSLERIYLEAYLPGTYYAAPGVATAENFSATHTASSAARRALSNAHQTDAPAGSAPSVTRIASWPTASITPALPSSPATSSRPGAARRRAARLAGSGGSEISTVIAEPWSTAIWTTSSKSRGVAPSNAAVCAESAAASPGSAG